MTRQALITCCPGSGSTVFSHLLNAHPNLLSLNELQIHNPYQKKRLQRFREKEYLRRSSLSRSTPNLTGQMWPRRLSPWSRAWLYWAAYRGEETLARQLVRMSVKKRVDVLLNKQPNPTLIRVLAQRNPELAFIFIHRSPFAVINSILRKTRGVRVPGVTWGLRLAGVDENTPPPRLAAMMYGESLVRLAEARADSITVHELFYESFLEDPVETYFSVFEFLGVDRSPVIRASLEQMFEEKPLHASRQDAWKDELSSEAQDLVRETLSDYRQLIPGVYGSF